MSKLPKSPHVVVVGGGLSGLSAAFYAQRAFPDGRVTLCEAKPDVGGVIQTERDGDFLIEHGADMFATNPPDALQFVRDLGIESQLIEPKVAGRGAMIVHRGRLVPVPEGFVLMRPTRLMSMVKTPLLSIGGKARLLQERFVPKRDSDQDESVAQFTRRRLGTEMLTNIIQPLVGGIYTADPERLSMQATMKQFVDMEHEHGSLIAASMSRRRSGKDAPERTSSGARYNQFRGFPGGMRQWFDAIVAALPEGTLRRNTRIDAIEPPTPEQPQWRLKLQPPGGTDAGLEPADAVILALPAAASAKLVQGFAPEAASGLAAMETASSAIVVSVAPTASIARLPETFGFVVPAAENRKILACSFASHKFPGRVPEGFTLMRTFVGGALQPELCDLEDDALAALVRGELQELIGWDGRAEATHVVRWNNAMPLYHVGHRQRVAAIEQQLAAWPTLQLAGNSLRGVGIAPVIRTAKAAAEALREAS